jgi:hypothetical protein
MNDPPRSLGAGVLGGSPHLLQASGERLVRVLDGVGGCAIALLGALVTQRPHDGRKSPAQAALGVLVVGRNVAEVRSNGAPVTLQLIGGGIDREEGTGAHWVSTFIVVVVHIKKCI